MNPTPNQITECDDEKQLCEWSSDFCLGIKREILKPGQKIETFQQFSNIVTLSEWQPTSPTEKGKAQCWDLIVKYNLIVDSHFSGANYVHYEDKNNENAYVENETDLQIAVVKAALLCAMGD